MKIFMLSQSRSQKRKKRIKTWTIEMEKIF